ncbi:probable hydrolase PNKD [Larimichthys crocea]|uniref:probable hydrolase PNKD n=1 Tax=Larimichthys crocea TaxID=215358 RepID=UPI00090167DE|nr:probable hydrolase PNKD [Larimichthys crocea]
MPDRGNSTNMAAYVSAVRTALKGVHLVPGRWLLTRAPAVCQCFRLHVSPAASLCSSRTEPRRSTQSTTERRAEEEEEEESEGPEYIPKKKAKNPMMVIGYAWMIGLPTGIIGFVLAKREVDKNRLKQLKIRQRMKRANEGEYDGSRYRHHTENVKPDL